MQSSSDTFGGLIRLVTPTQPDVVTPISDKRQATNQGEFLIRHLLFVTRSVLLGSFDVASFGRVNADAVAFIDEGRDLNRRAVFKRRGLVDV